MNGTTLGNTVAAKAPVFRNLVERIEMGVSYKFATALMFATSVSIANAATFVDPQGYTIDFTASSTTVNASATKDGMNRFFLNMSSAGVVTLSAGNSYVSHGGLKYYIQLTGVGCAVVPDQMAVKNCTMTGMFRMPELPYGGMGNLGNYMWNVSASFDGSGVGRFTFSPMALPTDSYISVPRPAIGPFNASFRDFVLMAY